MQRALQIALQTSPFNPHSQSTSGLWLALGGQDEHVGPSLKPGWGHGISAALIWPGQTLLLEPKKGGCGTQVLDPKVSLQQSATIWFRLYADDECDDASLIVPGTQASMIWEPTRSSYRRSSTVLC